MRQLVPTVTILFVCLLSLAQASYFEYEQCGGDAVQFHNITFHPLPITLSKTHEIFLSANVSVLQNLPSTVMASLLINKTLTIGGEPLNITIPCLDGLGSCTLKVCDMWSLWYKDILCPFFTKANRACSCPIGAGVFEADDVKVTVPFDKFNGLIAQLASVSTGETLITMIN